MRTTHQRFASIIWCPCFGGRCHVPSRRKLGPCQAVEKLGPACPSASEPQLDRKMGHRQGDRRGRLLFGTPLRLSWAVFQRPDMVHANRRHNKLLKDSVQCASRRLSRRLTEDERRTDGDSTAILSPKPLAAVQDQTTLGRAGAESCPERFSPAKVWVPSASGLAGPCPCAKVKASRLRPGPMDVVRHRLAAGA